MASPNVPVRAITSEQKKPFNQVFNHDPTCVVISPGRVNLIGEHIDYCGFDVFPMALSEHITVSVSPSDTKKVTLVNTDASYVRHEADGGQDVTVSNKSPKWFDYFLAGYKGVMGKYGSPSSPCGLNILVSGSIPVASGLSSSSALVCAAAVATITTLFPDVPLDKNVLAKECASFERFIGVEGGGMDQAIIFLGEEGKAKRVSFVPTLSSQSVPLPSGVSFFVSHCGTRCNKGATNQYNIRVVETRLAAAIIAKMNGLDVPINDKDGLRHHTLQSVKEALSKSFDEMIEEARKIEPKATVMDQINSLFKVDMDGIAKLLAPSSAPTQERFLSILTDGQPKPVQLRALHVLSEALRVEQFTACCVDDTLTQDMKIHLMGHLMDESHKSCKELYDCSCPELDALVAANMKAGALGSRLTGAGWGGCTVSLVAEEDVPKFKQTLISKRPRPTSSPDSAVLNDIFIESKPCEGITLYQ